MHIGGCQWLSGKENKEKLFNKCEFFFWCEDNIKGQDRQSGCLTSGVQYIPLNCSIKNFVDFVLCEFHLKQSKNAKNPTPW